MTVVCLDACVLYPTILRHILLGCAERGVFRPIWSERILEEWARATRKLGPGAEDVARGEVALLRARWPDAAFEPRAADLARLYLPDENDVHVLAAAIAGSADMICTFNAKDFPRATLAEAGLTRMDPDQLLRVSLPAWSDTIRAVAHDVHATAEAMAGEPLAFRAMMKRARLPRLGKALD